MATKGDITEDKQLTCSICIETYKQPRYLTCGHTFCENCLFTYTHNALQDDVGEGSKFACPVCRKPHDFPENAEVTLEWIQTLPLNTVISQMVEKSESTEDSKHQRMCEPCEAEGEQIVGVKLCCDCGEVLCKDCTKCHKNFKITKHHKLIDLRELPEQDNRTNIFSGISMCLNHSKWELNLYCKSHGTVICAACIAAYHSDCNITDIMQFTHHDIDMEALEDNLEKVHTLMKAMFKHIESLQTIRGENKKNIKQKLKEIRENTEQARARLDVLMENVVKHVKDVTKQVEYETERTLDEDILRITILKQETEQEFVRLDTAGKHGSERHKLVSVQQMKTLCEEFQADISEEDELMKTIEVELKVILVDDIGNLLENTDVEKLIELKIEENESSHAHLGDISDAVEQCQLVANPLRDSNLVREKEHTVRPNSECEPSYSGITVLHDGRLMLVDNCEVSPDCGYLCLYNPLNNGVDKLKLNCPSDVAQIDDTRIAVCLPKDKSICIVAVHNDLRVEKSFETKSEPSCVQALKNGQLAISCDEPASFSIIDISGEDLVQIMYLEEDKNGRKFESFWYFVVDERRQHVIQSGDEVNALYCFELTGEPVFRYSHPELKHQGDMELDKCGNIYVCECDSPGSIHKISPAGEPINIFKEGVPEYPQAICCDSTSTTFWVTPESYDEGNDKVTSFYLQR